MENSIKPRIYIRYSSEASSSQIGKYVNMEERRLVELCFQEMMRCYSTKEKAEEKLTSLQGVAAEPHEAVEMAILENLIGYYDMKAQKVNKISANKRYNFRFSLSM